MPNSAETDFIFKFLNDFAKTILKDKPYDTELPLTAVLQYVMELEEEIRQLKAENERLK